MSTPDPVAIAASVIADPRRLSTVANRDLLAICQALVTAVQVPQISDELAGAARALIRAEATHTMAKNADGYAPLRIGLEREQAFFTFRTFFEQEFPQ